MHRVVILAALVGCGDGRTLGSDGGEEVDASARGIVRVKVTGFVEKAGLHVYFQERDSSLSLATRTDPNGEATGRLGPDGFVTLIAGFEPTLTVWTYTGVQPGDELEFFEPDVVDVETPVDTISIFANSAGDPPFTLRTSCGGGQTIVDPFPVALPLALCTPRVDFLLERGQVYRYVKDADLSQRSLYFTGEFVDYGLSTVTVKRVPGQVVFGSQTLIGQGLALEMTNAGEVVINGDVQLRFGLPLPADGTVLTQIDIDDPRAYRIVDWRPATEQTDFVYDDANVAGAETAPRYDATSTSVVWTDGSGTPGDLVRATLHWLDGAHSRTRSWVVIGPRGDEPVLHVPLLPSPDLVPSVEVPQTMESFVTGDQHDWARRHLHGRWLSQGVTWPAEGPSGHIEWRSL